MITNNPFHQFYPVSAPGNSNTAKQLKKYVETAARREQMGLEGDGADAYSFAAEPLILSALYSVRWKNRKRAVR